MTMSEVENQLNEVEITIEKAKAQVEKSEALRRLEKNKDFKSIFLEGLLKEDAIGQVHLLASPQLFAPGPGATAAKKSIKARLRMIGEFANYCRYIHQEGESSRAALADHEETRGELLAEQLEEI
jgi:hypothetical protein